MLSEEAKRDLFSLTGKLALPKLCGNGGTCVKEIFGLRWWAPQCAGTPALAGAPSVPADNPCHLGEASLLAAWHFCSLLQDRSKPHWHQGRFSLTSAGSVLQREDVTQLVHRGLFLVTSAPSPVPFHTPECRGWDAGPLPGSPRAGLSEPGSLHAVERNPPLSTQGT